MLLGWGSWGRNGRGCRHWSGNRGWNLPIEREDLTTIHTHGLHRGFVTCREFNIERGFALGTGNVLLCRRSWGRNGRGCRHWNGNRGWDLPIEREDLATIDTHGLHRGLVTCREFHFESGLAFRATDILSDRSTVRERRGSRVAGISNPGGVRIGSIRIGIAVRCIVILLLGLLLFHEQERTCKKEYDDQAASNHEAGDPALVFTCGHHCRGNDLVIHVPEGGIPRLGDNDDPGLILVLRPGWSGHGQPNESCLFGIQ